MGGGKQTSTTVQKADPWGPTQEPLEEVLPFARYLWSQGAFAPPTFTEATGQSTFAGPSNATEEGLRGIIRQARGDMRNGNRLLDSASQTIRHTANQGIGGMNGAINMVKNAGKGRSLAGVGRRLNRMAAGNQLGETFRTGRKGLEGFSDGTFGTSAMEAAQDQALSKAVPAAVSMFAGSGMANSGQAMDTVGQAALDATAPYAYDAMNQDQSRRLSAANALTGYGAQIRGQDMQAANIIQSAQAGDLARMMSAGSQIGNMASANTAAQLQAAGMAPEMYAASFMPAQMVAGVGGQRDAINQAELNAQVSDYNDSSMRDVNNLMGYTNFLRGVGGVGGTQTGASTQPGPSMGQQIGGSLLGGLGTYGALAANPVTAPFAIGGGVLSGLMGLF